MPERVVSVSRVVHASPDAIFDVLADPSRHPEIDGSGSVKQARTPPGTRLGPGSKFGMSMRIGVPYRIGNTVVEFDEDRRIAWSHFGGHRWRYELQPERDATRVVESFDWSTSKAPWFIEMVGYPRRHVPHMERTLERLAAIVET
jgi:hypothetical protein